MLQCVNRFLSVDVLSLNSVSVPKCRILNFILPKEPQDSLVVAIAIQFLQVIEDSLTILRRLVKFLLRQKKLLLWLVFVFDFVVESLSEASLGGCEHSHAGLCGLVKLADASCLVALMFEDCP